MAARLAGAGTAFLGTLFDLARRGVLQFEEGPKQWGSRTFDVLLRSAAGPFEPHERVFVEELFKRRWFERGGLTWMAFHNSTLPAQQGW